jgi:hypothetical protein
MRKATRLVAAALGVFAGFGGPEHGIFEMLQGHVKPEGLMIASMGPPCDPEKVWNLCKPAMTVVPSFLFTGILATLAGWPTSLGEQASVDGRGGRAAREDGATAGARGGGCAGREVVPLFLTGQFAAYGRALPTDPSPAQGKFRSLGGAERSSEAVLGAG